GGWLTVRPSQLGGWFTVHAQGRATGKRAGGGTTFLRKLHDLHFGVGAGCGIRHLTHRAHLVTVPDVTHLRSRRTTRSSPNCRGGLMAITSDPRHVRLRLQPETVGTLLRWQSAVVGAGATKP